jgi:hypothetical protein
VRDFVFRASHETAIQSIRADHDTVDEPAEHPARGECLRPAEQARPGGQLDFTQHGGAASIRARADRDIRPQPDVDGFRQRHVDADLARECRPGGIPAALAERSA